jgi:divalent metal cation (Fe/Co/Zn/Cd) transporter
VGAARSLERWGWRAIALNVLLALLHALVAAASSSLAVSAEFVHNFVDFLSSVTVLVGLKLAGRRSRAFPYGLHKVENLVAAGLAGLVFVTAYKIGRYALVAPSPPVETQPWMLVALFVTTVLPLVFSHFELRAGRAAGSPSLIAEARELRVPASSSRRGAGSSTRRSRCARAGTTPTRAATPIRTAIGTTWCTLAGERR